MSAKAIFFDSSRCSACKGCQVACKCWNGLPSPTGLNANPFTGSYQSPMDLNGDTRLLITFNEQVGGTKGVQWAFGRRSCMHCENPACVRVCPSGALSVHDETGFVKVNDEVCVGCQFCSSACPFDVPHYYGPNSKINKCDGCLDRIEQGREPACVSTCQPDALLFGDREEMLKIAHDRVDLLKAKGYDKASVYGENELEGLHLITVLKYGIEQYTLPEEPRVSDLVNVLGVMKPLAGAGMIALVAGLGLCFLTGVGYNRDKLRYDEVTHDVIDEDTGEIIKHIELDGTVVDFTHDDAKAKTSQKDGE